MSKETDELCTKAEEYEKEKKPLVVKRFIFTVSAEMEVLAKDEVDAYETFWNEIEGEPQQNACDWIHDHMTVVAKDI